MSTRSRPTPRSVCPGRMIFALVTAALVTGSAGAEDADVDGCKDSPLMSRYPKSVLYGCDHKDFDAAMLETSKDGNQSSIEGDVTTLNYTIPPGASDLTVYRNVRTALTGAGYQFLYEESPYTLTARKGAQYIHFHTGGGAYDVVLVKQQAMEQVMTADAASMREALKDTGHVAIYGIEFETAQATLLASADPTLQEVLKLLQQDASLKIRVEGHTDNVGKREANQALSERRAAAVVGWLVAHGVARGRLTAQGFADSKPVSDNGSEQGRAKNRRVELVKIS